jgi:hypothetical protein
MIFQFADKSAAIKHLCFILEVKKLNSQTLRIKETMIKGSISEDLLFYETEKALKSDLKKLFNSLDEYSRYVNDMQKQAQIGFSPSEEEPLEEEPLDD